MYMNVCVSNKSSVHETFKTAGTNSLKLVQTGSIMFQIFEIMNFEIFSWKFLLEIFKISNLYTLKIIEVYSIAPPSDPFKVENNFAQKWIAWNDLRTFNLETPFGNTTWTHHLETLIWKLAIKSTYVICYIFMVYVKLNVYVI